MYPPTTTFWDGTRFRVDASRQTVESGTEDMYSDDLPEWTTLPQLDSPPPLPPYHGFQAANTAFDRPPYENGYELAMPSGNYADEYSDNFGVDELETDPSGNNFSQRGQDVAQHLPTQRRYQYDEIEEFDDTNYAYAQTEGGSNHAKLSESFSDTVTHDYRSAQESQVRNQHSRGSNSAGNEMPPSHFARGANPRNKHGIQLKPVSCLPDVYRGIFKFGVFNAIQSQCFDEVISSDESIVISAPTGSGKTVLFELAVVRLLQKSGRNDAKAVYIAPTKALCSERYRDWSTKFAILGIKCSELTGDTAYTGGDPWGDAKHAKVIITTPEKLDSLSRHWGDFSTVLSQFELLMVDEVHILNESRGSTLEVVISRMKTHNTGIRFVLVSATVPNVRDVAAWIGRDVNHPALIKEFGDNFRPCKLTQFVYGYPKKNQNDFQFTRTLDFRLYEILEKHSESKPTLIFVSTRKGVITTANQLKKDHEKCIQEKREPAWANPNSGDFLFKDKSLQDLAICGIGVHHAGLTIEDRRLGESLFLRKTLRVMVATSTLAVGVNLPAHMVVIKGTKLWVNDGWSDYSDIDIVQMVGRAGRPQFDKEGVAVIMCDTQQEAKFRNLVAGRTELESSLHLNLTEHLNSEIALTTISDIESAKCWLRGSFLFQRIQKNPSHYGLDKDTIQSWQGRLDALVSESIDKLTTSRILEPNSGERQLTCTEFGVIMSKYYIRYSTMMSLMSVAEAPSVRDLLETISAAEEFGAIRLRTGDKQLYNKLREDEAIRYPLRKVENASNKVFVLMQAILGGVTLSAPEYRSSESQPHLEAVTVFKHASRIARAMAEVAIVNENGAQLKNSMSLVRALSGKAWEDRPVVLRQLEKLGDKSIKVLAMNGISTFNLLKEQTPSKIEMLLNRKTPFGHEILAAACDLPAYDLFLEEVSVTPSDGVSPVSVLLQVRCSLCIAPGNSKPRRGSREALRGMTVILILDSNNKFIDFRRIPTKALRKEKAFTVSAFLENPSQSISVQIGPDQLAGLTKSEVYKSQLDPANFPTRNTRPISALDADLQALEDDPDFWNVDVAQELAGASELTDARQERVGMKMADSKDFHPVRQQAQDIGLNGHPSKRIPAAAPPRMANGRYLCKHACKDKLKCRHLCCREGLPKPPKLPQHSPTEVTTNKQTPRSPNLAERQYGKVKRVHENARGNARINITRLRQDNSPASMLRCGAEGSKKEKTTLDDLSESSDDLRSNFSIKRAVSDTAPDKAKTESPVPQKRRKIKHFVPTPLPLLAGCETVETATPPSNSKNDTTRSQEPLFMSSPPVESKCSPVIVHPRSEQGRSKSDERAESPPDFTNNASLLRVEGTIEGDADTVIAAPFEDQIAEFDAWLKDNLAA